MFINRANGQWYGEPHPGRYVKWWQWLHTTSKRDMGDATQPEELCVHGHVDGGLYVRVNICVHPSETHGVVSNHERVEDKQWIATRSIAEALQLGQLRKTSSEKVHEI